MNAAEKTEPDKTATTPKEHRISLGLGSNISPETNLPRAVALLGKLIRIERVSSVWETTAVGSDGPNFLNAALTAYTNLSKTAVKAMVVHPVEQELGRQRSADKNAPRTIDIDLLVYDGEVVSPQVWAQAFAAVPLAELIPGLQRPGHGERLEQAALRLASGIYIKNRPEVRLRKP